MRNRIEIALMKSSLSLVVMLSDIVDRLRGEDPSEREVEVLESVVDLSNQEINYLSNLTTIQEMVNDINGLISELSSHKYEWVSIVDRVRLQLVLDSDIKLDEDPNLDECCDESSMSYSPSAVMEMEVVKGGRGE